MKSSLAESDARAEYNYWLKHGGEGSLAPLSIAAMMYAASQEGGRSEESASSETPAQDWQDLDKATFTSYAKTLCPTCTSGQLENYIGSLFENA
jgi:hypothetical protein